MKPKCELWRDRETGSLSRHVLEKCNLVSNALARTKENLSQEFSTGGAGQRLVQLALNEAEAVAWHTEFPHLVFPLLAAEKVNAAVAWQQRQQTIIQKYEAAFAA